MGEVYRGRDGRLERDVALKLLPPAIAADPHRVARFQREAQVLASLNHPHIAQIYGLEDSPSGTALVMELVEGLTLAARLERGPVPLEEALNIGRQIAEALEAAHDKGIVHRDLKPGNVMLTSAGVVKVLDFGLAGVTPSADSSIDVTQSPTLTVAATQAGMILGTAAYMSPEQAAGKPADKRADIWSFGVVLWELLTARRLFQGETISHTLAEVLRAPIDSRALPRTTPAAVRELLRRCLDRDPRTRLRDIGEARIVLQRALAAPDDATGGGSAATARPWPGLWVAGAAAALVVLLAAAVILLLRFRAAPVVGAPARFELQAPEGTTFNTGGVVSPDGQTIAFEAPGPDGRPMLWVRPLDSLEARALPGTEGAAAGAFWSPDGLHLGFGVGTEPRRLKRVDLAGGAPQTLAALPGFYRQGTWNREDDILYGIAGSGLWRVRATGGTPVQVTAVDIKRGDLQHSEAVFLPDGRRFLYHRGSGFEERQGIFVGSIDVKPEDQSVERLIASPTGAAFVPGENGGVILFRSESTLLAQRFDGTRLVGDPVRVAEGVGATGSMGWFSASPAGTLVYRTGRTGPPNGDLLWFDRAGKRVGQVGPAAPYNNTLQLSPDGRRVVAVRADPSLTTTTVSPDGRQALQTSGSRIWIADAARGVFGPLVSDNASQSSPVISGDGRVAYTSTANGAIGDLYLVSASGIGTPEPLIVKATTPKHANDFSPDGRYLMYDDHTAQRQDLYVLPLQADASGERKPIPFVVTAADETGGQFSPDGRWVVYSSDESGRREVYVQGFAPDRVPATAVGKWTISTAGGDKPRWSADGRELYYLSPDRKLMVVPVTSGATFEPGVAAPLFDVPVLGGFVPYAVGPDGRFLLNVLSDVAATRATPLTVVINWRPAFR
jgi:Tol biopolymer transport system component